ncbi:anaerobic sulfatase maturase [Vibrio parahaemolyticus]|uniref:anaerobic sulfatase maturase n=1 Tax=Vibrio parahaemolyticus TaxID=670 RepID=UPI0024BCE5A5|nr:anaerobic sulfatase maturase [Vibrio parahaemolyticus]EGQ8194977.1 anaerobic sulfatase maturase [Vibrio parahaemolyticus]WHT02207.1 anaerobic sulfatase maturase [Vibrio parahaemolyticus]
MTQRIENFQLMAKPSGSVCNIDCSYCFYLEKEHLYPERKTNWRMDEQTLENYIRQNIEAQNSDVVDIVWQGGEPTMLGIDFFRKALTLQERYKGKKQLNNYIQTNGINLNEEWAIFLKENNFLVGLSIDGDRISNDAHRVTRSGKSTFDSVLKGLEYLKKHKVEFNTLTVVNAENVKRPMDVYNFLKRIGSRYMQFIPLVERAANEPDENGLTLIQPDFSGQCAVTSWSTPAKDYGHFLNKIFDHWIQNDIGSVFVMNFEQSMTKMIGQASGCVINETCGRNLVIESNGDVYSCDHFVYPENKLGNINETEVTDLVNLPQQIEFGQKKLTNLSHDCINCIVKPVCNGGCPKHRFNISSDGKPNKNYFCEGYFIHLSHSLKVMHQTLNLLNDKASYKQIKKRIKAEFYS